MPEKVTRNGKVFRVGSYPDKNFDLTDAEAAAAVAAFRPVPANVEHRPSPLDGALGTLQRVWKEGSEIFGETSIPLWLHEHLLEKNVPLQPSLEWDRGTKKIAGVAWVNFPRIHDAALMSAFSAPVTDDPALFWVDPEEVEDMGAGAGAEATENAEQQEQWEAHHDDVSGTGSANMSASRDSHGKYHPDTGSDKHPFLKALDSADEHLDNGNKVAAARTLYQAWDHAPNHPATEHSNLASLKAHQNEPMNVIKPLIEKARAAFVGIRASKAATVDDTQFSLPENAQGYLDVLDGKVEFKFLPKGVASVAQRDPAPVKRSVPTPTRWSAGDPPTGFPAQEPEPGVPIAAKIGQQTKSIMQNPPVPGTVHMTVAQALLQALQMNPDDKLLQALIVEYTKKAATGSQSFVVNHGAPPGTSADTPPVQTYHDSYAGAVNSAMNTNNGDPNDTSQDDDANAGGDEDGDTDTSANMSDSLNIHNYLETVLGNTADFDFNSIHVDSAVGNKRMKHNPIKELHDHCVRMGAECKADMSLPKNGERATADFMTPEQLKAIQKIHDDCSDGGKYCKEMAMGTADYAIDPQVEAEYLAVLESASASFAKDALGHGSEKHTVGGHEITVHGDPASPDGAEGVGLTAVKGPPGFVSTGYHNIFNKDGARVGHAIGTGKTRDGQATHTVYRNTNGPNTVRTNHAGQKQDEYTLPEALATMATRNMGKPSVSRKGADLGDPVSNYSAEENYISVLNSNHTAAHPAGKEQPIMSRFLDKAKALFGLAGVPKEHVDKLTEEDLQETLSSVDFSDTAEFGAIVAENSELRAKVEAQEQQAALFAQRFAEQEEQALFAANVSELDRLTVLPFAKITPAEKAEYAKLAKENPAAFALVLPILKAKAPMVQFSDSGNPSKFTRMKPEGDSPAASLEEKTRARMKETGEPYHTAFSRVCQADPELAASHNAHFTAGGN